ncbi:Hpt domain-containing protein [Catenovulum maritimum]|uniref:HPt domain-containing protein n=1 Tax=Catenovulum maritimum TaxID=1513271 RepID=A0A0J8JHB5_9ALTE|nr:Hpt domain-containing protein [Catenovulum maritimum]KMT63811.1 hypothetical protein XM47_17845 [Catenovulum maritimum]
MAIDKADALARLAGNEDLLKMLVNKFVDQYSDSDSQIKALLDEQKVDEARMLAHSIKGAAGNLSMTDLFAQAKVVEDSIRDTGNVEPEALERLKLNLDDVSLAAADI